MFSKVASRLHAETNRLYQLRDEIRREGRRIVDLVSSNVNEHGITFPQPLLEEIVTRASRECAVYRPDSLGQLAARAALAGYYERNGLRVSPENLVLTPGTSVAYWYCFKLLADEGSEILCPQPSYPLFDYIGALSGVRLVSYRLVEERGWAIDLEHLNACVSTRTRAVVLISPHNPTGHISSEAEIAGLLDIAARHDLAVISDEVFSEFLLQPGSCPRPFPGPAPLVVLLNGFSKMLALPGVKLGWMALTGNPARVREAMRALELISDTFLPVNEIIQAAVPRLLEAGAPFLRDYVAAVRERWALARQLLGTGRRRRWVPPAGGFYLTVNLDDAEEEVVAMELLRRENVLAHPGYFYELAPHHLVLSFVQEPEVIREVYPRIVRALEEL